MLTRNQILTKLQKAKALKNTKESAPITESQPSVYVVNAIGTVNSSSTEDPNKLNILPLIGKIEDQETNDKLQVVETKKGRPKKRIMVIEDKDESNEFTDESTEKNCHVENCEECSCVKNAVSDNEAKSQTDSADDIIEDEKDESKNA